jgi:hypothetical protein
MTNFVFPNPDKSGRKKRGGLWEQEQRKKAFQKVNIGRTATTLKHFLKFN